MLIVSVDCRNLQDLLSFKPPTNEAKLILLATKKKRGSFWIEFFLPNFQDIHFWMRSSSNSPWVSPAPLRVPTPKPPSWRPMVAKAPCATWHAACRHPRGLRNDASEQLNMAQGSTMHWRFCPMKLENNRKIQDIIKQIMWCQYLDHHILQLLCCLRVDTTVSRSIACSEVGAVRSPASFHLPRSLHKFVHTNLEEMWRCQCWAYLLLWDPRVTIWQLWLKRWIWLVRSLECRLLPAGMCVIWISGGPLQRLVTVLVFELMPPSGALVLPRNQVCDESCMTVRYFKCGNFRRSRWWVAPLHLHKKPIYFSKSCGRCIQRRRMIQMQGWSTATLFLVLSCHVASGRSTRWVWRWLLRLKSKK